MSVVHNFSEPDFVSAYEIGEFVYFFFREVAVEFINCGKVSILLFNFWSCNNFSYFSLLFYWQPVMTDHCIDRMLIWVFSFQICYAPTPTPTLQRLFSNDTAIAIILCFKNENQSTGEKLLAFTINVLMLHSILFCLSFFFFFFTKYLMQWQSV